MELTGIEHPILGLTHGLGAALDRVAEVEPVFMSVAEKRAVLVGLRRERDRLDALTLRVLVAAGEVAEAEGARDQAAWLAQRTRTERGPNSADLELGRVLERRWTRLGVALLAGSVNLARARVIAHGLGELPAKDLPAGVLVAAEEHLIGAAAQFGPRQLAVLGRKVLEVVAPGLVEDQEAQALEREERRARESASLFTRRLGDGSSRITAKVPDQVADRLATYLDALTSPRHQGVLGFRMATLFRRPVDVGRGSPHCWRRWTPSGCRCRVGMRPR